jgi:hypothetical protein
MGKVGYLQGLYWDARLTEHKKSNMIDVKGERITFFRNASKYLPVVTE